MVKGTVSPAPEPAPLVAGRTVTDILTDLKRDEGLRTEARAGSGCPREAAAGPGRSERAEGRRWSCPFHPASCGADSRPRLARHLAASESSRRENRGPEVDTGQGVAVSRAPRWRGSPALAEGAETSPRPTAGPAAEPVRGKTRLPDVTPPVTPEEAGPGESSQETSASTSSWNLGQGLGLVGVPGELSARLFFFFLINQTHCLFPWG